MKTLDLSNHDFATFNPACLKAEGVERVILGVWDFGVALTMIRGLRGVGIVVEDLYAFVYYGLAWEDNDVRNALGLAQQEGGIKRVWLDCEAGFDGPGGQLDTEAAGTTVQYRINATLNYRARIAATGITPGIYTGLYWWRDKMADSTLFKGDPLWLANYGLNDPANPRDPIRAADFGGWTSVAVHQYSSTIRVCGRERDHNYWFLEDPMGLSDDDILAIFGSTERHESGDKKGQLREREYRLARAKERYQTAISTGRSVLEVAATGLVTPEGGKVPPGTKFTITGEVTTT